MGITEPVFPFNQVGLLKLLLIFYLAYWNLNCTVKIGQHHYLHAVFTYDLTHKSISIFGVNYPQGGAVCKLLGV